LTALLVPKNSAWGYQQTAHSNKFCIKETYQLYSIKPTMSQAAPPPPETADDFLALVSRAGLAQETVFTHMWTLHTLARSGWPEDKTLRGVLLEPETYIPRLREAYPDLAFRAGAVEVVLTVFRLDPSLGAGDAGARAREAWHREHAWLVRFLCCLVQFCFVLVLLCLPYAFFLKHALTPHLQTYLKENNPETPPANYTSYAGIEATVATLRAARDAAHATRVDSQRFVLLSLLADVPPKRANLGSVRVYRGGAPEAADENYVVLRPSGSKTSLLVLNVYKAAPTYGRIVEPLAPATVRALDESLRRWPREFVFADDAGAAYSKAGFDDFVKGTFQHFFNRATDMALVRRAYIRDKVDARIVTDRDAMQRLARRMGLEVANLFDLMGEAKVRRALAMHHYGGHYETLAPSPAPPAEPPAPAQAAATPPALPTAPLADAIAAAAGAINKAADELRDGNAAVTVLFGEQNGQRNPPPPQQQQQPKSQQPESQQPEPQTQQQDPASAPVEKDTQTQAQDPAPAQTQTQPPTAPRVTSRWFWPLNLFV
jgi:hypothetical protein